MWPAIVGAAAAAAGGDYMRYRTAEMQMDHQESMMDRQHAFNMEASNTQWQRGVADMKAAGLNPMLAYTAGPNSSPTSAMATSSKADFKGFDVASAVGAAKTVAEIDKTRAETENIRTDTAKKWEETVKLRADQVVSQNSAQLLFDSARKVREETENIKVERAKLHENVKQAEWAAMKEQMQAKIAKIDLEQLTPTEASILGIQLRLLDMEVPKALNRREQMDTLWMRNVAPYISDFFGTGGVMPRGRSR